MKADFEKNDEIISIIDDFINGNINEKELRKYSVKESIKNKKDIKNNFIYNEVSFQHELGNYLRYNSYNVKFEYNVKKLNNKINTCKKEIDLLIMDNDGKAKYAIELKYLNKNTAVPKRLFKCVEDMRFMQDVVNEIDTIKNTYCVVITEDHKFYNGRCEKGNKKLILDKDNGYIHYMEKNKKIDENQYKWSKELTEKYEDAPNIYEYFRNNNEIWRKVKYMYSNSKDSLYIYKIDDFNDVVANQFKWKTIIDGEDEKYYILKFYKNRF